MDDLELYYEMRNTIKAGDLEKMKKIINNYGLSYFPAWEDGYKLLRQACVKNHNHLAEYLLSKNAKVNCDYALVSPLQIAVMKNNKKLVKLLLEHGAKSYTNKNKSPLQIAVEKKNLEIAKLLFEHNGVKKSFHELSNSPERPTLHVAILSAEYSMVKLLLENGFNVNVSDINGIKSIHLAIRFKLLNILQLLLEFDADVNARTKEGYTPIFLSLLLSYYRYFEDQVPLNPEQDPKMLKLLIDYKADINMVNPNNYTPLQFAYSYTRHCFPSSFREKENLQKLRALLGQMMKLRSQKLYIAAGNLREISLIREKLLIKYGNKCVEELIKMVRIKVPNTNISMYHFITKNDNFLASCVKNDNVKTFVSSDRILSRFPNYGSTIKICFSRGVRRNFLLEESVKVFENNWPHAANLLTNCLVHVFKYLNNHELHEFIWTFN